MKNNSAVNKTGKQAKMAQKVVNSGYHIKAKTTLIDSTQEANIAENKARNPNHN